MVAMDKKHKKKRNRPHLENKIAALESQNQSLTNEVIRLLRILKMLEEKGSGPVLLETKDGVGNIG
jgi:predicted RNase H-like nuclease (RuvC/YqgF family)